MLFNQTAEWRFSAIAASFNSPLKVGEYGFLARERATGMPLRLPFPLAFKGWGGDGLIQLINLENAVRKFHTTHQDVIGFRGCEFIRTEHVDCANEFAPTRNSTAVFRINNPGLTHPLVLSFPRKGFSRQAAKRLLAKLESRMPFRSMIWIAALHTSFAVAMTALMNKSAFP